MTTWEAGEGSQDCSESPIFHNAVMIKQLPVQTRQASCFCIHQAFGFLVVGEISFLPPAKLSPTP